jgi:hypothetical protein
MVNNQTQDTVRQPANQGVGGRAPELSKITAFTPYDFEARNPAAHGSLPPVGARVEKLGFQKLLEETVTIRRRARAMPAHRLVPALGLACYAGYCRRHPRFRYRNRVEQETAAKPQAAMEGRPLRRRRSVGPSDVPPARGSPPGPAASPR